ncbi:hypothetical protein A0126_18775 (plasmid) [Exiguobacterium sp. N4-1P]|uniref:AAA family ATPase n=1 Tax=Exiguobacterium sp. N4-1P TaxID=2051906 RepID=UPI000B595731|nr:AAA family ATPase [Exiguobacterium sp. N4-1P]ASI36860.1 hypothetical protein A0126_15095 [Exiguobacterium sp. N4-1P]ASI37633.1 hypothetical protein A0126_18775 [Exiguobacterium sp. N4-1P]
MLKNLSINKWNQFNTVKIDFHPKVTIITGSNGAGKSTLFRMLSSDMGWGYAEVSNPVRSNNEKEVSSFRAGLTEEIYKNSLKKIKIKELEELNSLKSNYYRNRYIPYDGNLEVRLIELNNREREILLGSGFLDDFDEEIHEPYAHITDNHAKIGKIELDEGVFSYYVPVKIEDSSYNFTSKYEPIDYYNLKNKKDKSIEEEQSFSNSVMEYVRGAHLRIPGLNIPSHRHTYTYEKIESVPIHASDTNELIKDYFESIKRRALNYADAESPIITMKKSIISLALFSESNSFVEGNLDFKNMFNRFNQILRKMLPDHIKFKSLYIGSGEVVLETESGNYLLDAVSGGIGALIDIIWQVFIVDFESDNYVVLIDELENHLHPSMQREILPKLLETFPNAQFVISTHSPFVINSVNDCKVYALKYNNENMINSHELDFDTNSGDAFEILKEVLGVSVTMPIWMEKELKSTINQLENKTSSSLTLEDYNKLKKTLHEKGLINKLPDLLNLLLENDNDNIN